MSLLITGQMLNLVDNTWNSVVSPGLLVGSWDSANATLSGPITPSATGFVIQSAGFYKVDALLSYTTNGAARPCVGCRIAINGAGQGPIGQSGYIRNATGHVGGTSSVWLRVALNVGDTVGVLAFRATAAAGAVTASAGTSSISLERIT